MIPADTRRIRSDEDSMMKIRRVVKMQTGPGQCNALRESNKRRHSREETNEQLEGTEYQVGKPKECRSI
jgi:hypothetical protein